MLGMLMAVMVGGLTVLSVVDLMRLAGTCEYGDMLHRRIWVSTAALVILTALKGCL